VRAPLAPTRPISIPAPKPYIGPRERSNHEFNIITLCSRGCGWPSGLMHATARAAALLAFTTASSRPPHGRAPSTPPQAATSVSHRDDWECETTQLAILFFHPTPPSVHTATHPPRPGKLATRPPRTRGRRGKNLNFLFLSDPDSELSLTALLPFPPLPTLGPSHSAQISRH
jgi:hypothetical protein